MGRSHRGFVGGKILFFGWQTEWVSVCACVPFGFGFEFINSNITESEVERVICMEKERSM